MSVCAKFQPSSWSRSCWKVCGGGEHVTTMSNSKASCFRVELSWVELRWVLTIYKVQGVPENLTHFVLDLLHFKILFISYVKPFILKLTQNGEKWVLIVLWNVNNPWKITQTNSHFKNLKKIGAGLSKLVYLWISEYIFCRGPLATLFISVCYP